jgi:hypothetical protein
VALSVSCLVFSAAAFAQVKIDRIVVFGASLNDPGNAFVLLSDPAAFGFSEVCIGQNGHPGQCALYGLLVYCKISFHN